MFCARRILVSGVLLVCGTGLAAEQTCFGPGDVNADGAVLLDDVAAFAQCLAGPGQPAPPGCDADTFARADLEGDADVDLADLARLAPYFDDTYFFYGPRRDDLEAEQLAMNLTGALRAPDLEYQRILRDLALIRVAYPELLTVVDDIDYAPNQLIVKLVAGEPLDDYVARNTFYQLTEEKHLFGDWWVLSFCDNLNAVTLGGIYAALPAVQFADPNYLVGTDDVITIEVPGTTYRYTIDDGFMDCFDGCDCHRVWVLDVSLIGGVSLVSYEEWGMPWCDFGR